MSKAGRPKKDSAGLPDWFDIEKYRQAKAFNSAEWLHQLAFRAMLYEFLSPELSWPYCIDWLNLLKDDPRITIARVEAAPPEKGERDIEHDWMYAFKTSTIEEMTINARSGNGVVPVTNEDIRGAYSRISISIEMLTKFHRAGKAEKQLREKLWDEQGDKPFQGNTFGRNGYIKYARVDLALPDAILKKDFADYLRVQRKDAQEAISPFFKNQDFSLWYTSGALP